jgi:hypothetical protein
MIYPVPWFELDEYGVRAFRTGYARLMSLGIWEPFDRIWVTHMACCCSRYVRFAQEICPHITQPSSVLMCGKL